MKNANLHFDEKAAHEYLKNIFIKNKKYSLFVKGTNLQVSDIKDFKNSKINKFTYIYK